MIPRAHIVEWQTTAPWPNTYLVEHDLILSRAICELYQNPIVREHLVFRGGTALHKLFFEQGGRFSEDLDFVQIHAKPIGNTVEAIRNCLDHWLGKPKWRQNQGRFTLYYRFETETKPIVMRKVKIEINTREHFNTQPLISKEFVIENSWYTGTTSVLTYALEELLGTKLRALYQRKKGRDLYDFWYVKKHYNNLNNDAVLSAFQKYMTFSNQSVTRAEFEKNILTKQTDKVFNNDISPLLAIYYADEYDSEQAYQMVLDSFVEKLPGEPWKGGA